MGIRGELYSTKVTLENRTYFFNVKENRLGDLYLNIVESKNKDTGGFDRQSVVLFADDLQEFLKGFDDSLRVMEKAVHEKKKTGRAEARGRTDREDRSNKRREDKPFDREDRSDRHREGKSFDHEDRSDRHRESKPFDRDERPRKPRGDRPFTRDEGGPRDAGGFKGRAEKSFGREGSADRPFKPRGDKPFAKRGDRPFVRDEGTSESAFGRKKFVRTSKPTAGAHGLKGPLHKNRIVKAVKRKDVPED